METKPVPVPLYCKKCGCKLQPDKTVMGYDEFTGTPIRPFLDIIRCPNHFRHEMDRLMIPTHVPFVLG